jgi:hypothetical protein
MQRSLAQLAAASTPLAGVVHAARTLVTAGGNSWSQARSQRAYTIPTDSHYRLVVIGGGSAGALVSADFARRLGKGEVCAARRAPCPACCALHVQHSVRLGPYTRKPGCPEGSTM